MKYRHLLASILFIVALSGCSSDTNTNNKISATPISNTITDEASNAHTNNIKNEKSDETEVIELELPNITVPDNNAEDIIDEASKENINNPEKDSLNDSIKDSINSHEESDNTASDNEANSETTAADITETAPEISKPDISSIGEAASFSWNDNWLYADHSMIHSSSVTLYKSSAENRKNKIIAVNAGHGTKGGSTVKTLCHPDGSPKVTGGSTSAGATTANAISAGMTFPNGTPEATVTLQLALTLKNVLLNNGYDVLMIRESEDTQIDNVARTVYANNLADCHISLHYDSTENNKGFFVIGIPDIASYKAMEPVASHYEQHNALANALISGAKNNNIKLSGSGFQGIDLTQTSYSTIPSVDVEVGDKGSDYSDSTLNTLSKGILDGLNIYFGF